MPEIRQKLDRGGRGDQNPSFEKFQEDEQDTGNKVFFQDLEVIKN